MKTLTIACSLITDLSGDTSVKILHKRFLGPFGEELQPPPIWFGPLSDGITARFTGIILVIDLTKLLEILTQFPSIQGFLLVFKFNDLPSENLSYQILNAA